MVCNPSALKSCRALKRWIAYAAFQRLRAKKKSHGKVFMSMCRNRVARECFRLLLLPGAVA